MSYFVNYSTQSSLSSSRLTPERGEKSMQNTTSVTLRREEDIERQLRIDLAAAFRLAAGFNWHESVGNHFSVAVSADGKRFLMNPRWRHFSTMRASELRLLDSDDSQTLNRPEAPDPSAWCIHSQLHSSAPKARCILHLHPPHATALATLADPTLKPIDQNTARFYGRIAQDLQYGGIADNDNEGSRLASVLGGRQILMMGNHGVLVVAATIPETFEDLYFLERACQTMVLAYSTGQELKVMTSALAARTAQDWERYSGMAFAHFDELKRVLDIQDPSYAH
jgi:ribulose-5-phosphate 4-epimerase/fuculose-1-phosphate aldolase